MEGVPPRSLSPTPNDGRRRFFYGPPSRSFEVHDAFVDSYDRDDNHIYLVKPWPSQDVAKVSTLLHELVHYVQFNFRSWPCPNETEWQAYKLQDAWLKEREIDYPFDRL